MKKHFSILFVAIFASCFAQSPNRVSQIVDLYESELVIKIDQAFHDGRYGDCLDALYSQLSLFPTDSEVQGQIVFMWRNVEMEEKAICEATRFRTSNPENPMIAFNEGNLYQLNKLYSRIPPILEPCFKNATSVQPVLLLAEAYEKLGLISEALRVCRYLRERFPNDPSGRRQLQRLENKMAGKEPIPPPPLPKKPK